MEEEKRDRHLSHGRSPPTWTELLSDIIKNKTYTTELVKKSHEITNTRCYYTAVTSDDTSTRLEKKTKIHKHNSIKL